MKNLDLFFEKALALQAQRKSKLTLEEKQEIALTLGFTQDDWQAIMDSFEGHWVRGEAFLSRNNYTQALLELQEAALIQPENPAVLAATAQAYLGLFLAQKKKVFQEKALQFAKEALQFDPKNEKAHQVIDHFNPTKHTHTTRPTYTPQRIANSPKKPVQTPKNEAAAKNIFFFGGLFALLLLIPMLIFGLFSSSSEQKEGTQNGTSEQSVVSSNSTQNQSKDFFKDHVPIDWEQLPKHLKDQGYTMQTIAPKHWAFKDSKGGILFEIFQTWGAWKQQKQTKTDKTELNYHTYQANFVLIPRCDFIKKDQLLFKGALVAPSGKKAYQFDSLMLEMRHDDIHDLPIDYHFHNGEDASLYINYSSLPNTSKNTVPINWQNEVKPEKLMLSLVDFSIFKKPSRTSITPLKVKYREGTRPIEGLELYERGDFYMTEYDEWTTHFWIIELHNKSEKTIKFLDTQVIYYDKQGKVLSESYCVLFTDYISSYKATDYGLSRIENHARLIPKEKKVVRMKNHLGEKMVGDYPQGIKSEEVGHKEIYIFDWR